MALSIRDKLFITFTNGDTRRGRVTRRVPWARPHRVADRRQRMDERERARERGRADARVGAMCSGEAAASTLETNFRDFIWKT